MARITPPASAAASGASVPTISRIGYNTVGASQEAAATTRVILKQVVLAAAGLLTGIEAYIDAGSGGDLIRLYGCVLTDNAGAPGSLSAVGSAGVNFVPQGSTITARWLNVPIGVYLPAGTHWIGVSTQGSNIAPDIYYDTGGSDRTLAGTSVPSDWTYPGLTQTTTTKRYSIRGTLLGPL